AAETTPAVKAKGVGEVVVLQPEYGAVTIRHEAIPEYNMGAMTMEFTTADPTLLNGIKVGDKVTFELKAATEIETIEVVKTP
ncbi:MAG: copper-binding protein, partial [Alphaproteobacteria bacterium]|nr:copper-binding protein [Alphaproteobacteria bacterium]